MKKKVQDFKQEPFETSTIDFVAIETKLWADPLL